MDGVDLITSKRKLAVLTSRFPYPLEKGDKLRIYHQMKSLSGSYDIYLFAIGEAETSKKDFEKLSGFVREIHYFRIDEFSRLVSVARGFFSKWPLQVSYFYRQSIRQKIVEVLQAIEPDHVYCQLARMAIYAEGLPYPKTLDYMDAFGVGMDRRAKVAKGLLAGFYKKEAGRMKSFESRLLKTFDHHVIISQQDAEYIAPREETKKLQVIPNGIDETFFEEINLEKKYTLVFVGNMGYLPNIEAAEFLVRKILPSLPENINLLIAGARPHNRVLVLKSDRVHIGGWFADIREAYLSAEICVAPIWSGTGQQNKILEAMALGLPCITTSLVNNAIMAEHGVNIMLADDVSTFVKAINHLVSDKDAIYNMGQAAKKFVKQNYSWDNSAVLLSRIFSSFHKS